MTKFERLKKIFMISSRKAFLLIIVILTVVNCYKCYTQQIVSNMGKSLQTLDGLISFTLGEVVISNFTIGSEIITQGFHQTNLTVTEVEDIVDNESKVKIFPNPTNSNLYISLGNCDLSNFKVQIYQYDGVLISILDSDQCLINLDFSDYLNGTYILKILKDNIIIGTYKVVKQKP